MVYIYILIDPRTQRVRYVGKTNNPTQRLKAHKNPKHNITSHKKSWIAQLRKEGLKPIMEVIDEVEESKWTFWEQYWYWQLKSWGFDLVNHTTGGEGSTLGNQTSFKKGNIPKHAGTRCKRICIVCNKEFPSKPSTESKYCSKKCYAEDRKGKSAPGAFDKGLVPWNKGLTYKIK